MVSAFCSTSRACEPLSTQKATPYWLVVAVHSRRNPVPKTMVWPHSGSRPEVSLAVRVKVWNSLTAMAADSCVRSVTSA